MEGLLDAPEKPKRKRKKQRPTHFVYFAGGKHDTDKIGCGFRCVKLVTIGPKWAHLHYPADGTNFRLPAKTWERLVRTGWEMDAKGRNIKVAIP